MIYLEFAFLHSRCPDFRLTSTPLGEAQGRDLLEVVDDRSGSRSTLIASQLPVENWHSVIKDPTIADALLDRLVHNAHKISLRGDSMRKRTPRP